MKSDGSDVKQLTNNSAADITPKWSGDGTKIVYFSDRDGNNEIYTMNADGSNQTRITNNAADDTSPNFSPDGTKITFTSDRDGDEEIYIMNADGSNPINLTQDLMSQGAANWSPDGTKIAFHSQRPAGGGPRNIQTIKIDGTDRTNLTDPDGDNTEIAIGPDWSPDGQWIIFHSNTGGSPCPCIFKIKPDGSSRTAIAAGVNGFQPHFSPDGTKIVFRSNRDGNNEVYTMNIDGSGQTRITDNLDSDSTANWQPLTIPPSTIAGATDPIDVQANEPITVDIMARHSDTYDEIDPSTLVITSQPEHGTATANTTDGTITYTYEPQTASTQSFLGQFASAVSSAFFPKVSAQSSDTDSLNYQICSTENSELCTTSTLNFALPDGALASSGELAETGQNRQLLLQIAGVAVIVASFGLILLKKRGLIRM
jgi:LPXTG-motif cell wall-anchored protein